MFEMKKRVYRFGGKTAEGDGSMRELLGGKMLRRNIILQLAGEFCLEFLGVKISNMAGTGFTF